MKKPLFTEKYVMFSKNLKNSENPNVVSVLPYKASELWAATFLKVNHTYTHTLNQIFKNFSVKAALLLRPWFDY